MERVRGRIWDRLRAQDGPPRRAAAALTAMLPRFRGDLGKRLARLSIYVLVAIVVLALPFATGTPASAARTTPASADTSRLALATTRDILPLQHQTTTVTREGPPELQTYAVQDGDTLLTIAAHYGVTAETIAYNNNVTDATAIHVGDEYRIPPVDAAIYTVKDGDTVESVAAKFGADVKTVKDTNRLYFEPDNFAAGKTVLIPVPDGQYPGFALKDVPANRPQVLARGPAAPVTPTGRLSWPVAGVLTQYFWYGHLGVDIAAPYGTGIGASDDGVVSAEGWVAVGGIRVCVQHNWGMTTCYYHMSTTYVSVGQFVKRGQIVGAIGMTGVTSGPHVHWEARYNGVLVNALAY